MKLEAYVVLNMLDSTIEALNLCIDLFKANLCFHHNVNELLVSLLTLQKSQDLSKFLHAYAIYAVDSIKVTVYLCDSLGYLLIDHAHVQVLMYANLVYYEIFAVVFEV